ncbi:N-terminal ig-like domain of cellulase [Pedobacter sp. ok626]|uniref:glycoside hydrolase family 9 protein n=1 Tax=Pedobacter sp. ok626 TaxID=1761882 RepID=UPI00088D600A|nr:glycoside hydrolase family 9 protein [Pedobacter sp. ok626]SDK73327.1 N-terminal ig-like domain of cellulase [Pedobacter sp. ok626]
MRIFFLVVFSITTNAFAQGIPEMPMKMPYENTLEYTWSQKKILKSKQLSDMETMDFWEHANFGTLSLSQEKFHSGKSSLLLTSPTKDEKVTTGRPWGTASAIFKVKDENWSDWNRISFWIYPDLPGFKIVSINLVFHNNGAEKVPDSYNRNGLNYQVLENHKWNKVYWEIEHLGRDKVTGVEIRYRLQGNEPGTTSTARYFIDEMYLEKVDPDHFEGWNVAKGQIAYNHAGYANGFPKTALVSDLSAKTFSLINIATNKTVFQGPVQSKQTPLDKFQILDFSGISAAGKYIIKAGDLQTKPFQINNLKDVYRSSIIKTINHFYSQRCGVDIAGIHDACHADWMTKNGDKMIQINGGWHDAGDLSQGLVNTTEAAYAMLILARNLEKSDRKLSDRLLEEAKWGLNWVLKNRFGDGFRSNWATYDMWTDGIVGTIDDVFSQSQNSSQGNFMSATTEATAAILFKTRDSFLANRALQSAEEDWEFASKNIRLSTEAAGAALNASLALYEATMHEKYKVAAFEYANYILECQQQTDLDTDVPFKGFFHRTSAKDNILHYPHRSHEQDAVVGLVRLSQLFPKDAPKWENALRLYADYYKKVASYTAPYYMLPAGIYDLTKAQNESDREQIKNGIRLNDRYYLKRFPVWGEFRGNSGTTLSQAKGLSKIATYFGDKNLADIASRSLSWHLGLNPFNQSFMYGEGYRYAGQYSVMSGNIVGGLPVGVQTHFNRDDPYWPAENVYNWKEIWVHPATRWLMIMSDLIN